ncbi:MAG: hypothetical protein KKE20_00370, partial [Nanoarchaeota archaeon]|nr:hypothetical protein [Nanoarchaeota archaeon]
MNKADIILKECKKIKKNMYIQKECSMQMVELASFPSVNVQNVALDLIKNYKIINEVAEKNDIVIYPLSVYPGTFKPKMRAKRWYTIQQKILGKEKFSRAGKTVAFHAHYTLPKGVFDRKTRFLKPMLNSKIKQTLIDSYNMAVAMDPALVTFLQASPFVDGRFLAKDSRVLLYRGGRDLG